MAFQLGELIFDDITNENYGEMLLFFFSQFAPLYNVWFQRTSYLAQFKTESLVHNILDILSATTVAFMTLFIGKTNEIKEGAGLDVTTGGSEELNTVSNESLQTTSSLRTGLFSFVFKADEEGNTPPPVNTLLGFTVALCLYHFIMLIRIIELRLVVTRKGVKNEKQKEAVFNTVRFQTEVMLMVFLLLLGSVFSVGLGNPHIAAGLLIINFFGTLFFFIIRRLIFGPRKGKGVPLNVGYVIQRLGEFTMLMVGEGVLQIIIQDIDSEELGSFLIVFGLSFFILAFTQFLAFTVVPFEVEQHALRKSSIASLILYVLSCHR